MATIKKPVAMCCVNVGYYRLLMPADKGMRMVELLQSAVECQMDYQTGAGDIYYVQEQPHVSLTMVKPSQVRQAATESSSEGRTRLIDC